MLKLFNSRTKNKRGFSLIELIVVIAIVGVMVMVAAPKFLGYTKDAKVTAMKSDAKILTDAAMLYSVEHDSAWPIGEEIVKSAELEAVIGDVTVYEIDEALLDPYVKKIKGEYSEYGIIVNGELEGEVVHLLGVPAKDETMWYSQTFSAAPSEEPEIYLATDDDFEMDGFGRYIYIGEETEIRIPHSINGTPITSYERMFASSLFAPPREGGLVTKVVSDNPNITNMEDMFYYFEGETIDLSDFDTSNVTNMSYMFSDSHLTTINMSGWDTSKVEDMNSMFYNSAVTSLDLSGWNTSSVMDMNAMFFNCAATSIDLSGWDTSSATDMSQMFGHTRVTSLNLSNFDTSSVTSMYTMFEDTALTSLDLSGWDTSNVEDMSDMFAYNTTLTTLDLSGWDTTNLVYASSMFCESQLTIIDLSSFDTSNLTSSSGMFEDAQSTIGYARTEADAAKLNASSGIPATLTFTVP